jgi:hypothetical protein
MVLKIKRCILANRLQSPLLKKEPTRIWRKLIPARYLDTQSPKAAKRIGCGRECIVCISERDPKIVIKCPTNQTAEAARAAVERQKILYTRLKETPLRQFLPETTFYFPSEGTPYIKQALVTGPKTQLYRIKINGQKILICVGAPREWPQILTKLALSQVGFAESPIKDFSPNSSPNSELSLLNELLEALVPQLISSREEGIVDLNAKDSWTYQQNSKRDALLMGSLGFFGFDRIFYLGNLMYNKNLNHWVLLDFGCASNVYPDKEPGAIARLNHKNANELLKILGKLLLKSKNNTNSLSNALL